MIESVKKLEMQQLINDENGENYHRNINLNGYISFLSLVPYTKKFIL